MLTESEKDFWIKAVKKTFVMFGFTYFSVAVTLSSWTNLTPSLLASMLYFFTELSRYYKLTDGEMIIKNKKGQFQFLI